jgi:hypothetical protein
MAIMVLVQKVLLRMVVEKQLQRWIRERDGPKGTRSGEARGSQSFMTGRSMNNGGNSKVTYEGV